MFRYSDGQYNSMPSGRPVSSLSSGSSDGVSTPSSPIFQLNFSSGQLPSDWNQRKKDRDSSSRGVMGADFPFPPQLIQQAFQESFSNARQNSGKKSPKPDSYKTVMCQAWLESKVCSFAENCRFAHGETELRPSKVMPKQNSKYKTKLCDKYTTTGLCPYGTRCLFIHPGVSSTNGNNAYIRPDKLVEVSQRHALAEITPQKPSPPPVRSVSPDMEPVFGSSPTRPQLRPHPSWPLEPANFFSDKTEDQVDFVGLFGCFEASTTPNRVSLTSGYGSGGSSPFSTVSSSSVNLTTSDEEHFERDYFRTMGLENLAEELTRNLTTTELW